MKRILLFVSSISVTIFSFSQTCSSLRYQDTIFHTVTLTTSQFGVATPYGVLAQPQNLFLDFYEPTGDTLTTRPLIVFQFGGGFTIGWRSEPDIPGFCNYFAKCGYAVASIDYRIGLNPLDTNSTIRAYYRGVQDERSAIRYLCSRAAQLKIDTSILILAGTSAGCFCAFANAFTSNADRPASSFGSLLEPTDLGCYDCSGNNYLGYHIPHIKAIVNQWGAVMDTSFIQPGENIAVISFHGDQDVLVPYIHGYPFSLPVFPPVYGSVPIHERLTNLGILNVLHPLVGFGHEPELTAPQLNDTVYNYTRPFLYQLLKPTTPAIIGDTLLCLGTVAHYSVSNTAGSRYCWNLSGNGTIVANSGNSIAVQWNDTGQVEVSVKELNYILAEGDVRTFTTYVALQPLAAFNYLPNSLTVTFTNNSTAGIHYHWIFGDGDTSSAFNPTKVYSASGTYTVNLLAENNYCSATASASFLLDSCPVADITYQLTNYNAFFYSPTTNTTSYFWNFGDGDSAAVNSANVFHQYTQDGTYTVTLKVRSQLGCEYTDTLTFTVGNLSTSISDLRHDIVLMTAEDGFRISSFTNDNLLVTITDVTGRSLVETNCSTNCELQTADFPSGLYIIRVSAKEQTVIKKFVR